MKHLTKLLVVFCILSVLVSAASVLVGAAETTNTAAGAIARASVWNNDTVYPDKLQFFLDLDEYAAKVPETDEKFGDMAPAIEEARLACAEKLVADALGYGLPEKPEDYTVLKHNTLARIAIEFGSNFTIKSSDAARLTKFKQDFNSVKKELDARIAASKEALFSKASLEDYRNYPEGQYTIDFSTATVGKVTSATTIPAGILEHKYPNESAIGNLDKPQTNVISVEQSGVNKYFKFLFNSGLSAAQAQNSTHNYMQIGWEKTDAVIFELDFSTDTRFAETFAVCAAMDTAAKGRAFPTYFTLDKGNFVTGGRVDGGDVVSVQKAVVKGAWTHLILILDYKDQTISAYVDYEYVATWSQDTSSRKYFDEGNYIVDNIRFMSGPERSVGTSVCMDNINVYNGTSPRDVSAFAELEKDHEKLFIYYTNVMNDEDFSWSDRYSAYVGVQELIPEFFVNGQQTKGSAKVKEAYDAFLLIDKDEILSVVKEDNLKRLTQMVAELRNASASSSRSLNNVESRQTIVDKIMSFMSANIFDTNDTKYQNQIDALSQYSKYVDADRAVNLVASEMKLFDQHFSLAAMQKHYDNASAVYYLIDKDATYKNASDMTTFNTAIALYEGAEAAIAEVMKSNNSQVIINCVAKIRKYKTVEEWEANYDFINIYITLARGIVKSGNYDAEFAGLSEALATYDVVNDYFYTKLQNQHIEEIGGRVKAFQETASFVERMGAVAYIDAYVKNNDIDPENETLNNLLVAFTVLQEELEIQKGEYTETLEQNTKRFLNAVSIMKAYADYKTLKPYYDRALVYYYSMNAMGDDVEVAMAEFAAIADKLEIAEAASKAFVEGAAVINAAKDKDEIYKGLVMCHKVVDNVDVSYEGAAEALATYRKALASYNEEILPLNAELSVTSDAMCSVRSVCNLKGVMSVIRSILY